MVGVLLAVLERPTHAEDQHSEGGLSNERVLSAMGIEKWLVERGAKETLTRRL